MVATRVPRDPVVAGSRGRLERPAPLREAAYEALVEMIILRELQPGQHLVENELAAELGVSRQPIREALQRLQSEGWVDLRPALGAFVHEPTDAEADELLSVRTLLEAESARLAARAAKPDQIEHLWHLHHAGEQALARGDKDDLVAANDALHTSIVAMSNNSVLANLIAQVARRVRWYYQPIAVTRGKDAWDEHAELITAIAARSGKRAGDLMRRHTERTREIYHQRRQEADGAA